MDMQVGRIKHGKQQQVHKFETLCFDVVRTRKEEEVHPIAWKPAVPLNDSHRVSRLFPVPVYLIPSSSRFTLGTAIFFSTFLPVFQPQKKATFPAFEITSGRG